MKEIYKPTGKYVPLAKRIIATNDSGKILSRLDIKTLHLNNLKKYQEKIANMPAWNWYEESYNRLY